MDWFINPILKYVSIRYDSSLEENEIKHKITQYLVKSQNYEDMVQHYQSLYAAPWMLNSYETIYGLQMH